MLGFDLSERTISRWMKRAPRDPDRAKRWLAFLRNLREAIAAMDSFTVPTITLGVLYCHAALPIMPTSATSPFPLFCAKFLALLTNCIRHNPAVFSDLAVSQGNGGDQCRKILCVCRHAAAMDLLHHGVDRSVIALWLGVRIREVHSDVSSCGHALEGESACAHCTARRQSSKTPPL
jgi:hypothetical protein